jgi:hypothetical protein
LNHLAVSAAPVMTAHWGLWRSSLVLYVSCHVSCSSDNNMSGLLWEQCDSHHIDKFHSGVSACASHVMLYEHSVCYYSLHPVSVSTILSKHECHYLMICIIYNKWLYLYLGVGNCID